MTSPPLRPDRAAKARAVFSENCRRRREEKAAQPKPIYTDRFATARAVLKAKRERLRASG